MTLTDKHVSDEMLNKLIHISECAYKTNPFPSNGLRLAALLELKQRRAEDKAKEEQ